MSYLSVRETALKWGLSSKRVQILCKEGRISGCERIGRVWIIPSDAKKPKDLRVKTGKYIRDKVE